MLSTPNRSYRYPSPLGYDMASPAHIQAFAEDVDADVALQEPNWPFFKRRPTLQLKPTAALGNYLGDSFYHSLQLTSVVYSNHAGLIYNANGIVSLDPDLLSGSGWLMCTLQVFMSNFGAQTLSSIRRVGMKVEDWGGAEGTATQVALHLTQSYECPSAGAALECTAVVRLQEGWRVAPIWYHENTASPVTYTSNTRWTVTYLRPDTH